MQNSKGTSDPFKGPWWYFHEYLLLHGKTAFAPVISNNQMMLV